MDQCFLLWKLITRIIFLIQREICSPLISAQGAGFDLFSQRESFNHTFFQSPQENTRAWAERSCQLFSSQLLRSVPESPGDLDFPFCNRVFSSLATSALSFLLPSNFSQLVHELTPMNQWLFNGRCLSQDSCQNADSDSLGLGWGLRFCISDRLPGGQRLLVHGLQRIGFIGCLSRKEAQTTEVHTTSSNLSNKGLFLLRTRWTRKHREAGSLDLAPFPAVGVKVRTAAEM